MRAGLVWRVGSSFLLDPNLNRSLKPHLQKVLPYRHPCHTWNLGLGTLCEVVKPPTSLLSTAKIVLMDLKGLGTLCELDLGKWTQKWMWSLHGFVHGVKWRSSFTVTWIIFKNHLLEVDLTQNRETIALQKLTHNCWFILFHHVWGLRMVRNPWK
jgi:hypothetical protein